MRTKTEMVSSTKACERCDGCGKLADTDDREPWTAWTSLPVHSAAAVLLGLVKPIACPICKGTGREPRLSEADLIARDQWGYREGGRW